MCKIESDQFERTRLLLGDDGISRLQSSRVAVFGIGGVGGHAAEALVRSGIGAIDLIDSDRVALSNLNRQVIALYSTVGMYKTEAMRNRLLDINPEVKVTEHRCFFLPGEEDKFPFAAYDYVIDAVDTVSAKLAIVCACESAGTPVISSMGAGNKLHPELFEIADIYETSVCPLAKVMRRELKKRGIRRLKCVYSKEVPLKVPALPEEPASERAGENGEDGRPRVPEEGNAVRKRSIPGSTAFAPSVAGLIMAGEVIRDLSGQ